MPDLQVSKVTAMKPADVMVRAVRFFTAQHWRVKSQNGTIATFTSVARLDWPQRLKVILLTMCLVFPGVLYYFLGARRGRREQTVCVDLLPEGDRCKVMVTYPAEDSELIIEFLAGLV
ncbi:MAG TPA: hypothetical protein VGR47_15380 [Terracidiphilus sp.]|nr:hypothetical protein [Terracidiphilus sp.]